MIKKLILPLAMAAAVSLPADAQPKAKAYMVADAHLDTQWNWDIQTTIKDYVWNTINQNLQLFQKYPDYIFNFEGAVKYDWMKEYYPREYEMLRYYVKKGRWHLSGSSWDATDNIVPSVESAIRNILLGQTFYRNEFGTESTDIFLPDCFGFSWTLPTIANHCGLIGFTSQKLGWRKVPFYDGDRRYPFNVGIWKGIDGSEVFFTHGYSYGQRWGNEDLSRRQELLDQASENKANVVYRYYGTGDIGGSPSIQSVEAVVNSANSDGPVEIISATSDQICKDFMPFSAHPELERYDGELLMDLHGTGCYTSEAAMKLYNRQNEQLADAAERTSVAAEMLGMADYPSKALTEGWRRTILHQFHDDLTGTSTPRVYEFSWNDELLNLKNFSDILRHSTGAVASQLDTRVKGTPVVLYNPLGKETTDIVELDVPVKGTPGKVKAFGPDGKEVNAQLLGNADGKAKVLVEATVPPVGYAVYDLRFSGKESKSQASKASSIENSTYKLTLNDDGDIVSLIDKRAAKELVKPGKAVRLAIFTENESYDWPAWEILKKTIDATPKSINDDVKMSLVEEGPLRSTLLVEKKHGDSSFRQYIRLYEGELADRIDFYNEVDWNTLNALVKAEFPLSVANERAVYDLGLGTVARGNNKPSAYEVFSHRWADLTDASGDYGVTVMNDCKYGWDKPDDNTIRLTLLHTPKTKYGYRYQDHQDLGHHTFTYTLQGHSGVLDQASADRRADALNQRVKAYSTEKHPGKLGKSFSAASLDNDGMALKAFKKAEVSDEYVVRVYDTDGKGGKGTIHFAWPVISAVKADGTEKTIGDASFSGNDLTVEVGPNSIATYKVKYGPVSKVNTDRYAAVPLTFDKKCFSWDGFTSEADFDGGFSYAAELIPESLVASGVPFTLENKALLNGKVCRGDTITLPEGDFNKLYILAAAATEETPVTGSFTAGKSKQSLNVPPYSGFIGQWGHTDHTKGYLYPDEVAFVGTHRHAADGDHPYDLTYMFKYGIDIPDGVREIVLPDNPELVIFAATAANEALPAPQALSQIFRTNNLPSDPVADAAAAVKKENILKPEYVIAASGYVNNREQPRFICDGDNETKWCDTSGIPSFIDFDLGEQRSFSEWALTNAGAENPGYITSTCLLQTRCNADEEWKTVDTMVANKRNTVSRKLDKPVNARYVRLLVVQPEQNNDPRATRIYEFALY